MSAVGKTTEWFDERLAPSNFLARQMKKIFPDHWSFMLGEIALYSFIVLLLSGTFLTLFFNPSMTEVIYHGSYAPLNGVNMSEAYKSTLDISFDVRGGLLMRQIHHWSALLFVASICVHLLRVFFTGAFRKPRELNWIIGVGLLTLAILEGFAGYSLPDDLLSGTGLRIAEGVVLSIPIVGTYLSMFIFGGEFPGTDFIPRLYAVHILLVPGIILGLLSAHLMMIWYQKHTQYPGPGRTNENVVGYRFFPIYTAKAGGFFFIVFGVCALLGAFFTINPVWLYGPYTPDQVSAGSQPDWYIGWLEGGLRMMPNVEWNIWGHTLSLNVLIPSVVVPGIMFTLLGAYPFIEAWATGDHREHHLLDRPRNRPVRTGLGVMSLVFFAILWIGGGNDLIAKTFGMSINAITWVLRVCLFVLPPLAFVITKRVCLGLQRRDRERLLHGDESGVIKRLPHGEFIEAHTPVSSEHAAVMLASRDSDIKPRELPDAVDENGVPQRVPLMKRIGIKLSHFYYRDRVEPVTEAELTDAHHHDDELDSPHSFYGELPAGDDRH